MPRFAVIAAILVLLASPRPLGAQERERERVREGMLTRLAWGGYLPPTAEDLRDTTIALYPDAHFYYADVALEHGGSFRIYAAADTSGQVYLLDAPASFRLLHRRHFRGTVDSAAAVRIAVLASRFGALLPADARIVQAHAYLMHASKAGQQIPFEWEATVEARADNEVIRTKYWIDPHSGEPLLMSRDCRIRCRYTVFDP